MASLLSLGHITCVLTASLAYTYFIIFLQIQSPILACSIIMMFCPLFFCYALSCYNIFHSKSGYISYSNTSNHIGIEKICKYKQNQQRKKELLAAIENSNEDIQKLARQDCKNVVSQYAQLYLEYSFCDRCEVVKIPRSGHCDQCDRCVLRRQKHSLLIGICIGQENIKFYMQYVLMAVILGLYMLLTLLVAVFVGKQLLNILTSFLLTVFASLEMFLATSVIVFSKETMTTFTNVRENITEAERKIDVLDLENNPFKGEDFYHSLFKSALDLVRVTSGPNSSVWMELGEQQLA